MILMLPPEVEEKVLARAAQRGLAPEAYLLSLVEEDQDSQPALEGATADVDDTDPEALNRAVAAMINRTPEQLKAAQEKALREFPPARELPTWANSIFDVIPVIRGDETDEQVLAALEELS